MNDKSEQRQQTKDLRGNDARLRRVLAAMGAYLAGQGPKARGPAQPAAGHSRERK